MINESCQNNDLASPELNEHGFYEVEMTEATTLPEIYDALEATLLDKMAGFVVRAASIECLSLVNHPQRYDLLIDSTGWLNTHSSHHWEIALASTGISMNRKSMTGLFPSPMDKKGYRNHNDCPFKKTETWPKKLTEHLTTSGSSSAYFARGEEYSSYDSVIESSFQNLGSFASDQIKPEIWKVDINEGDLVVFAESHTTGPMWHGFFNDPENPRQSHFRNYLVEEPTIKLLND